MSGLFWTAEEPKPPAPVSPNGGRGDIWEVEARLSRQLEDVRMMAERSETTISSCRDLLFGKGWDDPGLRAIVSTLRSELDGVKSKVSSGSAGVFSSGVFGGGMSMFGGSSSPTEGGGIIMTEDLEARLKSLERQIADSVQLNGRLAEAAGESHEAAMRAIKEGAEAPLDGLTERLEALEEADIRLSNLRERLVQVVGEQDVQESRVAKIQELAEQLRAKVQALTARVGESDRKRSSVERDIERLELVLGKLVEGASGLDIRELAEQLAPANCDRSTSLPQNAVSEERFQAYTQQQLAESTAMRARLEASIGDRVESALSFLNSEEGRRDQEVVAIEERLNGRVKALELKFEGGDSRAAEHTHQDGRRDHDVLAMEERMLSRVKQLELKIEGFDHRGSEQVQQGAAEAQVLRSRLAQVADDRASLRMQLELEQTNHLKDIASQERRDAALARSFQHAALSEVLRAWRSVRRLPKEEEAEVDDMLKDSGWHVSVKMMS